MKLLIEDRQQRDKEIANDCRKGKEFAEERRILREQIDALQGLVERPVSSHATGEVKDSLKLAKLGDDDDIQAYFTMYDGCIRGGQGKVEL